jgi:DNA-directed RNA polymerase subunit RPC12/RpoP
MQSILLIAMLLGSEPDFLKVLEEPSPVAKAVHHPRYPRVIFFHADYCEPCRVAMKDFTPWLRQSGWQVDDTDRAHVQLMDATDNKFGVERIPAMVLLTDDGKHSKPVPYTGRQSLLKMFDPPTVKQSLTVRQHSHKCGRCSTEWWHGPEAANNPRAHNCPKCGKAEFVVHREGR